MRLEPCQTDASQHSASTVDQLWDAYFETRESDARDRLVLHYAPLVKYVAGRVMAGLPTSVDKEDLVSAGIFGLTAAIERFDPNQASFETFAMLRFQAKDGSGSGSHTHLKKFMRLLSVI